MKNFWGENLISMKTRSFSLPRLKFKGLCINNVKMVYEQLSKLLGAKIMRLNGSNVDGTLQNSRKEEWEVENYYFFITWPRNPNLIQI